MHALPAQKFMAMDAEKRERILNAAMAEFRKGFHDASTDVIVKEAGISKGLLFHYFGTKEGLYRFLLRYAFETMVAEYFDLVNIRQPDLLERLWQMVLLKIDLSYKYPAIFEFLTAAYLQEKDAPRGAFAEEYRKRQEQFLTEVFANTDLSLFKEGVDPRMGADIVRWTVFGYADSRISREKTLKDYQDDYERYLAEFEAYLTLLRKVLYR